MNKVIKYTVIGGTLLSLYVFPGMLVFHNYLTDCIFRRITGIECPFCGLTRACYSILHFDIEAAFRFNAVSLVLPLVLAAELLNDFFPSVFSGKLRRVSSFLFIAGLIMIFSFRIAEFIYLRQAI